MDSEDIKMPLVLVTGAAGYLASHIIQLLQREGYRVRATVRSLKNQEKVKAIRDLCPEAKYPVKLLEADLMDDVDRWTDIVQGCDYVIHTASPFPASDPKNEDDVIKPAVDGTLNVLRACSKAGGVKRLVLTSSIAAVSAGISGGSKPYNEDDWTDMSKPKLLVYVKSKTMAEKAAWDYMDSTVENDAFELSVICPSFIIGPVLSSTVSTTMTFAKNLLENQVPAMPRVNYAVVDVRDVAHAHYKAMLSEESAGKRFIIHGGNIWFHEMAETLREEFEGQGYKIPTRMAPNFLVFLKSFIDAKAAAIYPMLDKPTHFDVERARTTLGFEPREIKTALIDMAYTMIDRGLIKKTSQYVQRQKGKL